MRSWLAQRVTYANVVSTLALIIAIGGGSAYAVTQISGSQIKDRSITPKKLKPNSLGASRIKESALRRVPRARSADRLGPLSPAATLQRCPTGTVSNADACVEALARPAESYLSAASTCDGADRRLPTWQELYRAVQRPEVGLAAEGELTAEVTSPLADGTTVAVVLASEGGSSTTTPSSFDGRKPYRCAVDPKDNDVLDPQP